MQIPNQCDSRVAISVGVHAPAITSPLSLCFYSFFGVSGLHACMQNQVAL